jgi:hypothetical protein
MRLPARQLLLATGVARLAIGAGLLARPELLARLLGVDSVTARRTAWLARMIGGREVALGVGTLSAGPGGRGWLVAQMVADGTDAAALGLAARARVVHPALGGLLAGVALGTVGLEAAALPPRAGGRSRSDL